MKNEGAERFHKIIIEKWPRINGRDRRALRRHLNKKNFDLEKLDESDIKKLLIAYIRHTWTPYEGLLRKGINRFQAREIVRPLVRQTLEHWRIND